MASARVAAFALLAAGAAMLSSCNRSATKAPTIAAANAGAARALHGFAVCSECGYAAGGDRLDVQVVDAADAAVAPLLARVDVDASRGRRIAFDVKPDPDWTAAGRQIALRATLRDARGGLRGYTERKTALPPDTGTELELILVPVVAR